ncbi:Gfo/Idh/MocA family protein [Jiella sp. M17.18]|uniref:Gfo/Idh/MocA family protein n=1 Tax=Jiella sp. M17.18 TaxID=3234247 RepID=UPI0034DE6D1A
MERARVGLVGLGFGSEFIPIYQAHPRAEIAAICQRTKSRLDEVGDRFGIDKRYTDFDAMLADPDVDFVHINSPIPDHAPQTIAALKAGKHVICTVPMATTLDEAQEIVRLVRETGLKYMMAETVVYSREYLFIKDLYDKGELGKIQYLQASHPQDMEGWPEYWKDMVPMHYATHVVSPLMAIVDGMAEYVSCFGSGTINDECAGRSGSRFAVESCHIKIKDSDVAAHVWRFLWDTARQYRESIDVYGSKKSFEWPLIEGENPVLHTAKRPEPEIAERVEVPDFAHRLPEPIRKFTRGVADEGHLSFIQGGGHGGSHPHLVNEFLSALFEDRDPFPNAEQSANWTAVGICAHQSALRGGEIVAVPDFGRR